MRKLMRLVVTDGFGKNAEVAGYYLGGKTGTAEKVGKHGYQRGCKEHFNVSAFISVFPMNAPRYAVYMMLDEPHGNKSTYGYSTAGWVAAPAAGKVIARIGADAGHAAGHQDAPEINQALAIPLQPGRPPGAPALPAGAAVPRRLDGARLARARRRVDAAGHGRSRRRSPRPAPSRNAAAASRSPRSRLRPVVAAR